MKRAHAAMLACGLLLPALGCGPGPTNDNPYRPPTGGAGATGHMPSGTVAVSIEEPAGGQLFGAGTLISIKAHVGVENGTDFIDTSSVRAYVTRGTSAASVETGQLVPNGGDVYIGRISLAADLPSDDYTLWVTATSSTGVTGKASVDFRIDSGPSIVIVAPVEGGSYRTSLIVEVKVTDPFGLEGPPTATVGPQAVALVPVDPNEDPPTIYRGEVKFDYDPNEQPLTGPQLLSVSATNKNGKRIEVQLIFIVDDQGPVIQQTTPAPGQIVGGIVNISAVVQDNAGVLDSSIIAIIGDETGTPLFKLPLNPRGGGSYGVLFDSARLTACDPPPATALCLVYPTISFRASDEVGNETVVGYDFAVDNVGPLADLDPPNVHDMKIDGVLRCSHSFDPLGVDLYDGDQPNDGMIAPQVFDLRARVEDRGNRAAGLKVVPVSLVDPNEISVYILDDSDQPLVVDTDGNGTCDDINPALIPTTEPPTMNNQVLKVRLAPVPPAGVSDFTAEAPPADAPCLVGRDPEPPDPLCIFEQPLVAIGYIENSESAIWSVEPIGGLRCLGNQFDTLANHITEGWACIAVGSKDRAGNRSVSSPLRVWIDYDFKAGSSRYRFNQAPPSSAGPPPSCRGIFANGAVSAGTCTTREYPPNQYCFHGHDCDCVFNDPNPDCY